VDTFEREQFSSLSKQVAGLYEQSSSLSKQIAGIDSRLAVVESNYATKADVLGAKNSIIMWVVSAVLFAQVIPTLLKAVTG
jgi:hypothetical protein